MKHIQAIRRCKRQEVLCTPGMTVMNLAVDKGLPAAGTIMLIWSKISKNDSGYPSLSRFPSSPCLT